VRGELQGYKIQTWTEKEGEKNMRQIDIPGGNKTHALITKFVPYSKNFVRIVAYNRRYNRDFVRTVRVIVRKAYSVK